MSSRLGGVELGRRASSSGMPKKMLDGGVSALRFVSYGAGDVWLCRRRTDDHDSRYILH
jgi:hypothetical protein